MFYTVEEVADLLIRASKGNKTALDILDDLGGAAEAINGTAGVRCGLAWWLHWTQYGLVLSDGTDEISVEPDMERMSWDSLVTLSDLASDYQVI